MTHIFPVSALKDNYIWVILNKQGQACAVDPGEAKPLIQALDHFNAQLTDVLITHHHWDHTGGLSELLAYYPKLQVFGPAHGTTKEVNHRISEGDTIKLPNFDLTLKVFEIPGHTLDHIAYYNEKILFCGDTLFGCGCGRVFEGTMSQMLNSLSKLRALENELSIYCAHEYTLNNIQFALTIEPNHPLLKERLNKVKAFIQNHQPSLPTKLSEEKATNPFLRWDDENLIKAVLSKDDKVTKDPVSIFSRIRQWKDAF